MTVDPEQARHSEHDGVTYFFVVRAAKQNLNRFPLVSSLHDLNNTLLTTPHKRTPAAAASVVHQRVIKSASQPKQTFLLLLVVPQLHVMQIDKESS